MCSALSQTSWAKRGHLSQQQPLTHVLKAKTVAYFFEFWGSESTRMLLQLRSKKRVQFDRTVEQILAFHQNVMSFVFFAMKATYPYIISNIGASI